jgi:hypothetical protein
MISKLFCPAEKYGGRKKMKKLWWRIRLFMILNRYAFTPKKRWGRLLDYLL